VTIPRPPDWLYGGAVTSVLMACVGTMLGVRVNPPAILAGVTVGWMVVDLLSRNRKRRK